MSTSVISVPLWFLCKATRVSGESALSPHAPATAPAPAMGNGSQHELPRPHAYQHWLPPHRRAQSVGSNTSGDRPAARPRASGGQRPGQPGHTARPNAEIAWHGHSSVKKPEQDRFSARFPSTSKRTQEVAMVRPRRVCSSTKPPGKGHWILTLLQLSETERYSSSRPYRGSVRGRRGARGSASARAKRKLAGTDADAYRRWRVQMGIAPIIAAIIASAVGGRVIDWLVGPNSYKVYFVGQLDDPYVRQVRAGFDSGELPSIDGIAVRRVFEDDLGQPDDRDTRGVTAHGRRAARAPAAVPSAAM